MPFHLFGPPPPLHVMPLLLTAGLASTATFLFLSRHRLSAVAELLSEKFAVFRMSREETSSRVSARENRAFSEYREQTLQKLEDEAREFRGFLEGLRRAADAKDFETFLQERRSGISGALPAPQK